MACGEFEMFGKKGFVAYFEALCLCSPGEYVQSIKSAIRDVETKFEQKSVP